MFYLIPVLGIAWGWLYLEEPVSWWLVAGAALVIFGVVLAIEGRHTRAGQLRAGNLPRSAPRRVAAAQQSGNKRLPVRSTPRVPTSAILPFSRTTIMSASRAVAMRCVITKDVRFFMTRFNVARRRLSVSASRADAVIENENSGPLTATWQSQAAASVTPERLVRVLRRRKLSAST